MALLPILPAKAETYQNWLTGFKKHAAAQGIKQSTLHMAFQGVQPNDRVIELDTRQPERKKIGFAKYIEGGLAQSRIDNGRMNFRQERALLKEAETTYGVPAEVLVALWGIETSYGKNTGGFDLISALSTLAWEGRRREFFQKELLEALFILQEGHISRQDFKGSWAGAMGQNQFMPSSWRKYAVDGNGDGHKDIWTTRADVFASSANYLKQNGWNKSYPWGWAVDLPESALGPNGHLKDSPTQPIMTWVRLGVHFRQANIPNDLQNLPVRLVVPDGGAGRAYLVTSNFDTILSWNRSTYFALTVGLLSDLIAKGAPNPSQNGMSHLNP